MKNPWTVTWWCVYSDQACRRGFPTYEAALLHQAKLKRRGQFNVQVRPK